MRRYFSDNPNLSSNIPPFSRWRIIRFGLLVACLAGLAASCIVYRNNLPKSYEANTRSAEAIEDWPQVEKWAELWVNSSPDNVDAILYLSDAYKFQQKARKLADILERFPVNDGRYVRVMTMRGDLLMSELMDIPAAEKNWFGLLQVEPQNLYARQRLTYIYSMTLQREKLQKLLRESITLGYEPFESYFYLLALSNLNFTNGLLKTSEWLQSTPDDRSLQIAHAVFLAKSTPDPTLALFDKETNLPGSDQLIYENLKRYPDSVELNAFLMERAMVKGDIDLVEQSLKRVDLNRSTDCRLLRAKAWVLKNQDQLSEANTAIESAMALNSLDWKCRLEYSEISRLLGNKDQAIKNAKLASTGKILESSFMQLPDATAASDSLMKELLNYILSCEDFVIAGRLSSRLNATSIFQQ
ncbi:hypothetical protein [Rubinisphaera sp.]|uniref:tetratricopeptide repeat protein n=1 Tax=Rubinisphaera sp. TaxID=2024857 RepID=UPI000C0F853C|nr:hypothetical protein [Rubinisphaera sp.]MBV11819.1 hypothetical protein [Rubinisphaera sp.]HCS55743.1 hypothetical protein [Planctomycetaceae bacterium]